MSALIKSDFFLRFASGFVLGAVALVGLQPDTVKANLIAAVGASAHIGRA